MCKSADGGLHWGTRRPVGTGWGFCNAIAVAPSLASVVYAGGVEGSLPRVWRSANAGESWEDATGNLSSLHPRNGAVYALLVAPAAPDTVVAGTTNGVFISADGGVTWGTTSLTYMTRGLAYDPHGNTLYAATYGGGVHFFRGTLWQAVPDSPSAARGVCLGLDVQRGFLFVGTDGDGVLRLAVEQLGVSSGWGLYR